MRLAVLQAAERQAVSPGCISFVNTMHRMLVRLLVLHGTHRLIVNPHPPGRSQLRMIRRRFKECDLLKKPDAKPKRKSLQNKG